MKVLLVNPPQTFFKNFIMQVEQLPLGLLYIAAVLKREGIAVEILDALREGDCLSREGDISRYGLSWKDIAERIRISKPDVVGISNPYSSQILNAVTVASTVKRINPDIITVLGGAHPTADGFDLMQKEPYIDICVRGEGEYALRDLIKDCLIKKEKRIEDIPGIVYRNKKTVLSTGEPKIIEKLDDLPFPAYEMLDMEEYLSKDYRLKPEFPCSKRVIEMTTSRGCPYNCIFCSVKCVMGNRFRVHSMEYVLSHIKYVLNKYRVEHIRFNDDNISLDQRRFDAILSGIVERKLKFDWDSPNGIRADTLDESLLKKMKDTGCSYIYIAAESGNQEVVNKIIEKNIDLSNVEKTLKLCAKIGIQADVYFIFGLPGETLHNMRETKNLGLKFLIKYNSLPIFFIATPLPGTRLLEICRENRYLDEDFDFTNLSAIISGNAVIHTEEFTVDEVNAIYRAANLECNIIREIKLLLINPFLFFKKVFLRIKNLVFPTCLSIVLFCLPLLASASELADYKSVRCIIHVHTDVSSGRRTLESYIEEAKKKGIEAIILTDADWRRWEYGVPPYRRWIKKVIQEKSVMTFGVEKYLNLIKEANEKQKDVVIIDGVQTNPFYYWSGNFFKGTMTLNNRNKDMLVVGLGNADDYKNMPLVANRKSKFDAYKGDKFTKPHQDLIDYVIAKKGLIFWSHPECQENILKGIIRSLTVPYHWDLVGTYNYTGFGIYWHGYGRIGKPKGIWDRLLSEYCEGRRDFPVWAIGELEEEGLGNVNLDDLVNMLYVNNLNRQEILSTLKNGRFYVAFEPSDKPPPILEEFTLLDESGANVRTIGEEASFSGNPIIKIRVSYNEAPDANIAIKLIRNSEIIKEFTGKSPLEIEYKGEGLTVGQKYYYRVDVAGQRSSRLISNPIFFTKKGNREHD